MSLLLSDHFTGLMLLFVVFEEKVIDFHRFMNKNKMNLKINCQNCKGSLVIYVKVFHLRKNSKLF